LEVSLLQHPFARCPGIGGPGRLPTVIGAGCLATCPPWSGVMKNAPPSPSWSEVRLVKRSPRLWLARRWRPRPCRACVFPGPLKALGRVGNRLTA